jgi:stringent starvation protein B
MDKRTDEKKTRLLGSLEQGLTMIHLDARRPGVLVPEHLKHEPHLLLNLSYRFEPPDLAVGEWGVRCTLTFGGKRFTIAVPWSALYAISSHQSKEFWMYPDDMPRELLEGSPERLQQSGEIAGPMAPPTDGKPEARAVLREVVMEQQDGLTEPPKDPPEPPRRGHLRLVK